jgi:hypothetical protein
MAANAAMTPEKFLYSSEPRVGEWHVHNFVRFLFFAVGLWIISTAVAFAAPPASCAGKFAGTWTVRVMATGLTYPSVLSPNGVGHAACPGCTPTGTWTCSGNTLTIFVNGISASQTLSPDGRTLTGPCCVSTRVGALRTAAKTVVEKSAGAQGRKGEVKDQVNDMAKSASCSDITGTSSTAPAATHCKDANRALHAARVTREKYPAVSTDEYKKAAAAARRAGDTKLELSILREAVTPPPAAPEEKPCADAMREAASYLTGAEAIKKEDRSCRGLTQAAENYLTAGRIFIRAIKPDLSQEEIANSCGYKTANELFLQRDALNGLVDKMRQNGLCDSPAPPDAAPKSYFPGRSNQSDDDHKNDCAVMRAKLEPNAPSKQWIDDQMKQAHCNPDGTAMSLRDAMEYERTKLPY